jgi:hypothetical protein
MFTLNGKNYQNTDELFHDAIAMRLDIPDIEKVKFEKYTRLQKIGSLLHLPAPLAILQITVKNPNQEERGQLKISDSWTRNQYCNQQAGMALSDLKDATFGNGLFSVRIAWSNYTGGPGTSVGTIRSTSGAYYHTVSPETSAGYYSAANNATRGIVIGTSTTAESLNHYTLQAPIANGTSAGQMSYGACTVTKAYDAGAKTWTATWARIINNNSGGTITVNECGLIAYWESSYNDAVLTNRDKLASGEAILDAGQLTVTYNIVITFP